MIIVRVGDSFLLVESVNKNIILEWVLRKFSKSLDIIDALVKTSSQNESLVVIFLTVLKLKLVVLRVKLGDSVESINLGPSFNLCRNSSSFQVKISHVTMGNTKVSVWLNEAGCGGNNSHLVISLLLLDELKQRSGIDTSDNDDVVISGGGVNVCFLGTTASKTT